MKRAGNLIEAIADPDNLRLAYWKAAKGKRHSLAVLAYGKNLGRNLAALREQILTGSVTVGDYRYFRIWEPKERQICASAFREQVLHHALMNICDPFFEKAQIHDSYASRRGKGVHAALERAAWLTRRHTWFLKLDVRKFFDSVHHEVLKQQLERLFKDERLLGIFARIIDSFSVTARRGLPIGNLTSQYFANHYLAGLDHYVKTRLRRKAYVRYMDDLVLWHEEKSCLTDTCGAIETYVQTRLACALKPVLLNRTSGGLPFLGYLLYPDRIRLSRASRQRFIRKFRILQNHYVSGVWSEARCQRHVLPLLEFTRRADARAFRKKVINP